MSSRLVARPTVVPTTVVARAGAVTRDPETRTLRSQNCSSTSSLRSMATRLPTAGRAGGGWKDPSTSRGWRAAGSGLHGADGRGHVPRHVGIRRRGRARHRGPRAHVEARVLRTLREPLSWGNTQLVARDPVEAVREMKDKTPKSMRTIGSLTLSRSLLNAGSWTASASLSFPLSPEAAAGNGLRRLSRCRTGHDQQPYLRWPHPAARVRSDRSGWAAGHHGVNA